MLELEFIAFSPFSGHVHSNLKLAREFSRVFQTPKKKRQLEALASEIAGLAGRQAAKKEGSERKKKEFIFQFASFLFALFV